MRRKPSSSGPIVKEWKISQNPLLQSIYPPTSAPHSLRVPPGAVASPPRLSHCQTQLAQAEIHRNCLSVTSWMGRGDMGGTDKICPGPSSVASKIAHLHVPSHCWKYISLPLPTLPVQHTEKKQTCAYTSAF